MTFASSAQKLCGQSAIVLGWRPNEFWNSTPAEIACVLRALMPESDNPADSDLVAKMMEIFPDAPPEVNNG